MFRFNTQYFLISLAILAIEIMIALFVHDRFIRPYMGDVLASIFVYSLLMTFFKVDYKWAALYAMLISIAVECSQYFNLVTRLGLVDNRFARIVLGSSFEWLDILAYAVGLVIVVFLESNLIKPLKR